MAKNDIVILAGDIDGLLFTRLRAVGLAYGIRLKKAKRHLVNSQIQIRRRDEGSLLHERAVQAMRLVGNGMLMLADLNVLDESTLRDPSSFAERECNRFRREV